MDYSRFVNTIASNRKLSSIRKFPKLYELASPDTIFLGYGSPNSSVLPFSSISFELKNSSEIISLEGTTLINALQYMPSAGYTPLLEEIKKFQTLKHDLSSEYWNRSDVLITCGSQEGLATSIDMLVEEGDTIIFQNPSYSTTFDIISPYNLQIIPVPEDEFGMCPRSLKEALMALGPPEMVRNKAIKGMPKVLSLVPSGSNPSGKNISTERKKEIYQLACDYDLIIMEDDPYYFINFTEKDQVSFMSLDTEGRVLRYDSFSKIVSAGLRVGFVTGPKPLLQCIDMHKQVSTMHPTSLCQVLIHEWMKLLGPRGIDQRIHDVCQFYRKQRDVAVAAAAKHLKGLAEWDVPQGGFFLWLKLLGIRHAEAILHLEQTVSHRVLVVAGTTFMANRDQPCPFIRISFSKVSHDELKEGIACLAGLLREAQQGLRSEEITNEVNYGLH